MSRIKDDYLLFLRTFLPVVSSFIETNTICLVVYPIDLFFTLKVLKFHTNCQYSVLTYITCLDHPFRTKRFEVIYDLLSIRFNNRIRVRSFVDEMFPLSSVVDFYPCSTWWEREVWDLFGVFFIDNFEIRRILTDYGFEGHPLRKDFPVCGYVESRYDPTTKRVVSHVIENPQEYRLFNFSTGWSSLR